MKKSKIIQLVLLGNLVINTPFIIGIIHYFSHFSTINHSKYLVYFTIVGFLYWSYLIPKYRFYSIQKITNKKEYFYWKTMSINTLLLWPDNFLFTKLEFWNDEMFFEYSTKRDAILKMEF